MTQADKNCRYHLGAQRLATKRYYDLVRVSLFFVGVFLALTSVSSYFL